MYASSVCNFSVGIAQRKLTQSHTGGLDVKGFDWARWHANAGALAHSYRRMWDEYEAIMQVKYHELFRRIWYVMVLCVCII